MSGMRLSNRHLCLCQPLLGLFSEQILGLVYTCSTHLGVWSESHGQVLDLNYDAILNMLYNVGPPSRYVLPNYNVTVNGTKIVAHGFARLEADTGRILMRFKSRRSEPLATLDLGSVHVSGAYKKVVQVRE
jgi:hypothetical protein